LKRRRVIADRKRTRASSWSSRNYRKSQTGVKSERKRSSGNPGNPLLGSEIRGTRKKSDSNEEKSSVTLIIPKGLASRHKLGRTADKGIWHEQAPTRRTARQSKVDGAPREFYVWRRSSVCLGDHVTNFWESFVITQLASSLQECRMRHTGG